MKIAIFNRKENYSVLYFIIQQFWGGGRLIFFLTAVEQDYSLPTGPNTEMEYL